jgi:hypothetical protein
MRGLRQRPKQHDMGHRRLLAAADGQPIPPIGPARHAFDPLQFRRSGPKLCRLIAARINAPMMRGAVVSLALVRQGCAAFSQRE